MRERGFRQAAWEGLMRRMSRLLAVWMWMWVGLGWATALVGQNRTKSMLPAESSPAVPKVARVNGLMYQRPTLHDLILSYRKDTYEWPGLGRTTARALYAEARGKPDGWSQDAEGFGKRFGSSEAVTVINGNVRLGMELVLHEDLRYIPCRGCRKRDKLANALLAEITARHDSDGRRFFTLTPTISDFAGPIIVHAAWYPGASGSVYDGFLSARTVFATRIGSHLIKEFVLDRNRKKPGREESTVSIH